MVRVLLIFLVFFFRDVSPISMRSIAQSLEEINREGELDPDREQGASKPAKKVSDVKAQKQAKNFTKRVKKKVAKEVLHEELRERRRLVKDNLQGRVKFHDKKQMRSDLIYKIATWPFEALYYAEKDLLSSQFTGQFASQSYSSSGRTQDITDLVFGEKNIVVQDILLASKLLLEGSLAAPSATKNGVTGTQYHYLYVLANQPLEFNGSTNREYFNINYARHFKDDLISFGVQLPIARRRNKFNLGSSISPTDRESLQRSTPAFYNLFSSLEAFFEDILNQQNRNISFNKRDTEWGMGDITAFFNLELKTHLERFVVGFKAVFPTSQERITERLWFPELGNGGFIELAPFIGLLWNGGSWFWNPHCFTQFTYTVPATVSRRLPRREIYTPSAAHPVGAPVLDFLNFGKSFNGTEVNFAKAFSDFDSRIRNFPDSVHDVKIHKGCEAFLRIGNIFEHFFSRKAFLDLFLDVRMKGKDYTGRFEDPEFDPSIITGNTFRNDYRIGLNAQYQFDSHKRFDGGGSYVFAGRNVPRTFEVRAAFSIEI